MIEIGDDDQLTWPDAAEIAAASAKADAHGLHFLVLPAADSASGPPALDVQRFEAVDLDEALAFAQSLGTSAAVMINGQGPLWRSENPGFLDRGLLDRLIADRPSDGAPGLLSTKRSALARLEAEVVATDGFELIRTIDDCDDVDEATARLNRDFGLSVDQALHLLINLRLGRRTRSGRRELEVKMVELAAAVVDLAADSDGSSHP